MGAQRNHHFVPQFYLRNFGDDRRVAICNIATRRHTPAASIRGQCQRSHLYGKDGVVEKFLGRNEAHAAAAIRDVLSTGLPPPVNSEAWIHLLAFSLFQWGRTPVAIALHEMRVTKLTRAVLRTGNTVPAHLRKHIDDDIEMRMTQPGRQALALVADLGPVLMDLRHRVLANDTAVDFITSDAPIVRYNSWCQEWPHGTHTGFACAGLQMFLPLSSRYLLVLYDGDVYRVGSRTQAPVVLRDVADVQALNSLQLLSAERSLYYSGNEETRRAIDRLPFNLHRTPDQIVGVQRAVSDERLPGGRTSELLRVFERSPSLRFALPSIVVLPDAAQLPLKERVHRWRPAAMRADELARGKREEPSAGSGATRWRLVAEE